MSGGTYSRKISIDKHVHNIKSSLISKIVNVQSFRKKRYSTAIKNRH